MADSMRDFTLFGKVLTNCLAHEPSAVQDDALVPLPIHLGCHKGGTTQQARSRFDKFFEFAPAGLCHFPRQSDVLFLRIFSAARPRAI